jgi:hypothetical protein
MFFTAHAPQRLALCRRGDANPHRRVARGQKKCVARRKNFFTEAGATRPCAVDNPERRLQKALPAEQNRLLGAVPGAVETVNKLWI